MVKNEPVLRGTIIGATRAQRYSDESLYDIKLPWGKMLRVSVKSIEGAMKNA